MPRKPKETKAMKWFRKRTTEYWLPPGVKGMLTAGKKKGGKKMAPRRSKTAGGAAGNKPAKKPAWQPVTRRQVGDVEVLDVRGRQVINVTRDTHVHIGGGKLTYSHATGGTVAKGMPAWAAAALARKKKKPAASKPAAPTP